MELIRISENKIKIMLSATDMTSYDLPRDGVEYGDARTRAAFRAVLKDAGKKSGISLDGAGLSIQLYPSRSGGCEMFVTRNEVGKLSTDTSHTTKPKHDTEKRAESSIGVQDRAPRWERAEAFGFASLEWMLSVCRDLYAVGFRENSAAFRDEKGRFYLLIESPAFVRSLITEYGTSENVDAVRLYISEYGKVICPDTAIERLGVL